MDPTQAFPPRLVCSVCNSKCIPRRQDYYLNLIAWSDSNILAVALGPSVYTWNAETNSVQLLCQLENGDIVTSVSWMASQGGARRKG